MEAKTGNSGMLYHELQVRQLCGLHALNAALQGPFFSEGDLLEIAADLDAREREVMYRAGGVGAGDFLAEGQGSHNVSDNGDFGVEVLKRALERPVLNQPKKREIDALSKDTTMEEPGSSNSEGPVEEGC
ncbi:hypothetical protein CFC21_002892 [Triticum aestivum]|uniref:ubiquitinyl hydrolase 1 n=2 Tax=Triticum TaxID=4564 RepID=A0A3B5Y2C0_WHEAT|nr:hypothetical protein TRIUR3_35314 [Triticum urartu]KAF6984962.1 hypothetical protein CFC21_002892 [Triticum aestivum]